MKRDELFAKVEMLKNAQRIAAESLDDETALKAAALYPEWSPGTEYNAGDRVRYADKLYRVRQQHVSAEGWEPDIVPALFEVIALPTETGTQDCPIAYTVGMALENGKYYVDGGIVYRCTRDTGTPVYHPLSALIGLYVETA